jgi:hypothetical protein
MVSISEPGQEVVPQFEEFPFEQMQEVVTVVVPNVMSGASAAAVF